MPAGEFEFIREALPPDADLTLALAECSPAEGSPWRVPSYTFHMRHATTQKYMGRLRLRVHALLRSSPFVRSYRLGDERSGSWGATVVTLR